MYSKKQSLFQQIFFSRGMVVALFFLILFVGYSVFSIVGKSINAAKERRVAEMEESRLKTKENELSAKLSTLKTVTGQEEALREQFPVVKPGERVVVITDQPVSVNVDNSDDGEERSGFWHFLRNLFK